MSVRLGLFDIMQIDPTDPADSATVYRRRLDDLALADELGLGYAFSAERHFLPTYRCPAPAAWLGAASQRTTRIRLGVLAYTLPIHSPALLAEEVAVLDQLTGGRLEVGLGLGHRPEELVALGVDPAKRITIFQERLVLLQALWGGGKVTLESEHNTLRDVAIHPLPMQEPHPPLWYAGTDPGAASWAGGRGMSLAVGFKPMRDLVPATAAFKTGRGALIDAEQSAAEGMSKPGQIALMRHVYLAESDAQARTEMTDDLLRLRHLHDSSGEGSRPDRRAAAEAEADKLIQTEVFIAGGPETVAGAIQLAHRALGVDLFLGNPYAAGIDEGRIHRALRLLAGEVTDRLSTTSDSP